jgi:MFS family permease
MVLSRIFLDLPAGVLSDRFGSRRLLIFGIGLSLFGPILCAFATNIYILILGRAIWGVGSALYFMNIALLMDILPLNVRGRSLGFFQALEYTGNFLGAPIGAFLATYASFSHVFYLSLMMTFASLVIALRSGRMKETEARGSDRTRSSLRVVIGSLKS